MVFVRIWMRSRTVTFLLLFIGAAIANGCGLVPRIESPAAPEPITVDLIPFEKDDDKAVCTDPVTGSGSISVESSPSGGSQVQLNLKGLKPNRAYLLTLDEQAKQESLDVGTVTTDDQGNAADKALNLDLPAGEYQKKVFVKDEKGTPEYCIALYTDRFKFTVK